MKLNALDIVLVILFASNTVLACTDENWAAVLGWTNAVVWYLMYCAASRE